MVYKRKIPSPVVAELYSTDEEEAESHRYSGGITRNILIPGRAKVKKTRDSPKLEGLSPIRQKLLMKGLNWNQSDKNKDLRQVGYDEDKKSHKGILYN